MDKDGTYDKSSVIRRIVLLSYQVKDQPVEIDMLIVTTVHHNYFTTIGHILIDGTYERVIWGKK